MLAAHATGWFTCFRRGELEMGYHVHNQALGASQVSGNIPLDVSPCAATEYVLTQEGDTFAQPGSPDGFRDPGSRHVYTNPMIHGQLTLFDGRTPHRIKPEREEDPACAAWWDARPSDHCRSSAAFDILPQNHMPALHQAVLLFDPSDEEWHAPEAQAQLALKLNTQVESIQRKIGLSGSLNTIKSLVEDIARLDGNLAAQSAAHKRGN